MITAERSIDIEAPADQVWAILGRFMHIDDFHPRVSKMSMDFEVKYGPIGWLMGKTMMSRMMGGLFLIVLRGLEERVVRGGKIATLSRDSGGRG